VLNKAKILKNAEKHVLQGKIPAAIAEYQKILEFDPDDLSLLNIIGDLYVRMGNIAEGLNYFERLATAFYDGGFKVKAIAIFKKITKLNPCSIEAHRHLAELYVLQGLMSEAQTHSLQLAGAYRAQSKLDQAAEVLRELLRGNPDNTTVLFRLVDIELEKGDKAEALDLLTSASERLRRKGNLVQSRSLLYRAQEIDGQALAIKVLLAKILFAEGQHDAVIQNLLQMDPSRNSPDVQLALWDCFIEDNRLEEAAQVACFLFEKDPSHYPLMFTISERFLTMADFDRALKALDPLVQATNIELFGAQLSEMLQKILSEEPDYLPAIERSVDVNRRMKQTHLISLSMEHLVSYHIKHENYQEAMMVYEELLEIDPENSIVRQGVERLQSRMKVHSAPESVPVVEEGETPLTFGVEQTVAKEPQVRDTSTAPPFTAELPEQSLSSEDKQEVVNNLMLEGEMLVGYGLLKRAAQTFEDLVRISPRHSLALRRLVEIYSSLEQFSEAARCCAKLSKLAFRQGQRDEASQWTAKATQLDEAVQSHKIELEPVLRPPIPLVLPPLEKPPTPPQEGGIYDLSGELEEISRSEEAGLVSEAKDRTSDEQPWSESLKEVDFYMDQGFWAEAVALIQKLQIDYPGSSELKERLERCNTMTPAAADREIEAAASPSILTVGSASKPIAVGETSATPGLGDIFSEFDIVASPAGSGTNFSTHYNLGIAFREMGLLEEAIAELQTAISALNPEIQKQEILSVSSLLGLCLVEAKNYPEAVECLGSALAIGGGDRKDEEYLSLQYDLANACAMAGDLRRARGLFQKIHLENPHFRDTAKRIQELDNLLPAH
jgi:tetratricopeptide (TPR) repeat protein